MAPSEFLARSRHLPVGLITLLVVILLLCLAWVDQAISKRTRQGLDDREMNHFRVLAAEFDLVREKWTVAESAGQVPSRIEIDGSKLIWGAAVIEPKSMHFVVTVERQATVVNSWEEIGQMLKVPSRDLRWWYEELRKLDVEAITRDGGQYLRIDRPGTHSTAWGYLYADLHTPNFDFLQAQVTHGAMNPFIRVRSLGSGWFYFVEKD